jgi:hypothetical protein
MFLKIVAIIAILIAAVLVFAATRPNTFRIQRSIEIQAAPEKIFVLIDDFHNWPRWAPQDKEDPSMKRSYSGPVSGAGAISEWQGSGNTGRGRMLITESVPLTMVSVQTDFVKPFEARNVNTFVLEPDGSSTKVTWTMQGPNLYVMKVMGIFMNMDRMMGKHFESGLSNLKAVAESN